VLGDQFITINEKQPKVESASNKRKEENGMILKVQANISDPVVHSTCVYLSTELRIRTRLIFDIELVVWRKSPKPTDGP
jgi:transcriptional regulator of NAD metabolism